MKTYLKGLRLIWWSRSMDDLLFISIVPCMGLPLPFIFLVCLGQSFYFTYRYIRGLDTHEWYWEMIDRSGVYKCHLHDQQFSTRHIRGGIICLDSCFGEEKQWNDNMVA